MEESQQHSWLYFVQYTNLVVNRMSFMVVEHPTTFHDTFVALPNVLDLTVPFEGGPRFRTDPYLSRCSTRFGVDPHLSIAHPIGQNPSFLSSDQSYCENFESLHPTESLRTLDLRRLSTILYLPPPVPQSSRPLTPTYNVSFVLSTLRYDLWRTET